MAKTHSDLNSVPNELDLTHSPKRGNIETHQREILTPKELAKYLKIPLSAIYPIGSDGGALRLLARFALSKRKKRRKKKKSRKTDQVLLPDHGQREISQGRGIQNKREARTAEEEKRNSPTSPPAVMVFGSL